MADLKQNVAENLAGSAPSLITLSHQLYETPELAFEEHRSAALVADLLESGGMKVERSIHGLETAFRATAGSGDKHFLICAEYDALPEIGHACGHNIIAAAAAGAGLALREIADDLGIRLTVLGTPAEESGGGKIELLERGAFDGADVAMMVHPAPFDVTDWPSLAWAAVQVTYVGREAHASAFPQQGKNALDALNIAYFAIAALRQHIHQNERIHGIVTHGGDAPNIVPKLTRGRYFIRAGSVEMLQPLKERVAKCFEAGALATGCEVELEWEGNDYDVVRTNHTIAGVFDRQAESLGRTPVPRSMVEQFAGSTDMGNVSQVIPTIHPMIGIDSLPAVNHQADFAAHTISPAGDKAVTDGATALAWTVIDLATGPGMLEKVSEEFRSKAS